MHVGPSQDDGGKPFKAEERRWESSSAQVRWRGKRSVTNINLRLELQRIKFMVNSYLRIRLEKIQKNISDNYFQTGSLLT